MTEHLRETASVSKSCPKVLLQKINSVRIFYDSIKFQNMIRPKVRVRIPFQITPGQKMTDMTSHDHEASLISRIIETEGVWKLAKKFHKIILLFNFYKSPPYFIVLFATP